MYRRAAAFGVIAALALTGCGGARPVDPCQVNPTYLDASGQWREADGEPLDDDPCDSDDLKEDDGGGWPKLPSKSKRRH